MSNAGGVFWGCVIVLAGLVGVLVVSCTAPAAGVNSFARFWMVGSAVTIAYAFGVMVGVSAVYHARRRGRFVALAGSSAVLTLIVVMTISGDGSILSRSAVGIEEHIAAAVIAVWVFLPLVGLFFGSLAVAVGRRPEISPTA